MTLARRSTALLVVVSLLVTTLQPAAYGVARKDYVRYADSTCRGWKRFNEYEHCAPWRLWLRSGRVLRLKDARMLQPGTSTPSPIGASPHGSTAAYYRLSDDALVIRDVTTGRVRAVPGEKWSPIIQRFSLSPGGRYAIFPYGWNPSGTQSRVVDTVTGQVHTFPFTAVHISFSPDNRYVLAYPSSNLASRTLPEIMVYSTETWTEVRRGRSPAYMPAALRMGGTTIAFVDPTGGTPYIRFRDVVTGASAGPAIKVPAGESGLRLAWDRADHLDLLTEVIDKSDKKFATYRWRRANGGMRVLDTYTHSKRTTF